MMEKKTAPDPMCTIPGGLPQTTPEIRNMQVLKPTNRFAISALLRNTRYA